jgi:hypothetical protein
LRSADYSRWPCLNCSVKRASTARREAYFVELAGAVRAVAAMPVLVTGGFRTRAGMIAALEAGELDLIGIGRPLIAEPGVAARLIAGEIDRLPAPEAGLFVGHLMPWFNMQLERLGDGLDPDPALTGEAAAAMFGPLEAANIRALVERRAAEGRAAA